MTPLKKRRLARESLSVDGSLRSISEEEDSPSTRTASPPTDASSFVDSFTLADEYHRQVTLLVTSYCCCPRSMQSGVCPSMSPAHSSEPAGLLLWAQQAGSIDRLLQQSRMEAVPRCQRMLVAEHRLVICCCLWLFWIINSSLVLIRAVIVCSVQFVFGRVVNLSVGTILGYY